jgi:hypothetical protein
MKIAIGRPTVIMLGAVLCYALAGMAVAAQSADNRYNDEMLKLPPEQQAAKLAEHLGLWCVGTRPFFMGVTKEGPARGYAYWSVECAGQQSYMVQITPDGRGAAVDCKTLKTNREGRQCYKAF